MTIHPHTVLKNFDGTPLLVEEKPVELQPILINALLFEDAELKATAEQKLRAYALGIEITTKDDVELSAEDIVFIKARLLKSYTALIYGQVVGLLE